MQAFTIRSLRTILVAGTLFLAAVTASAQQEVSPDHFEGPGAGPATKTKVVKAQKHATAHKAQATKQVASNKKNSTTDVAGK
jgi:hypothetical protein